EEAPKVTRHGLARRAALSWARSRQLSPQRLWPHLRANGGVEGLLALSRGELSEKLGSETAAQALSESVDDSAAERWAADWERDGMQVVAAFDAEYPALLAEIADPPFVLYARGSLERLKLPAVAIVGSREATRYGRDVATRLARELSSVGVAVVSGFARG